MVSPGDKALLFRNRDVTWLEESGSPSVDDKGFLVCSEDGNFFLKGTSVSVGNKARLFNINNQYYLRSAISELGKFKWRVNCSENVHGIKAISNGNIFVGTERGVWAFDSDGNTNWINDDLYEGWPISYYTDISISSDETKLFIGDENAYLHSFDTANGTEIWNWSDPASAVSIDFWSGLVIDSLDNIYGGGRNGIVSVDKDGIFRWGNSTVGEFDYHLTLDSNQLYVPNILPCNVSNASKSYNYSWGDGYSAIDLNSGEINWIGGRESGLAVEYYNNRVYYGAYDELDCTTTSGGLIYRYDVDIRVEDIIIDTNDNCYFFEYRSNNSNCIKKLDSDGNLIWIRNMTNAHCVFFGPHAMVIDSDILYVATNIWGIGEGTAFGIKLSSGNINWSYPLTYDSESGGALSPSQDTYYFGSGQYLYALET